jgi:hypothetical protein
VEEGKRKERARRKREKRGKKEIERGERKIAVPQLFLLDLFFFRRFSILSPSSSSTRYARSKRTRFSLSLSCSKLTVSYSPILSDRYALYAYCVFALGYYLYFSLCVIFQVRDREERNEGRESEEEE